MPEQSSDHTPSPKKEHPAENFSGRVAPFSDLRLLFHDMERVLQRKLERFFANQRRGIIKIIMVGWLALTGSLLLVINLSILVVGLAGAFEISNYIPFYVVSLVGLTFLICAYVLARSMGKAIGSFYYSETKSSPEIVRERRARNILSSRLKFIGRSLSSALNPVRVVTRFTKGAAPAILFGSIVSGLFRRKKQKIEADKLNVEPNRIPAVSALGSSLKTQAGSLAIELAGAVLVPLIARKLLSELTSNGHDNGGQEHSKRSS